MAGVVRVEKVEVRVAVARLVLEVGTHIDEVNCILMGLSGGVWSPGGPGGVGIRSFSEQLGPSTVPNGPGAKNGAERTSSHPPQATLRPGCGRAKELSNFKLRTKA